MRKIAAQLPFFELKLKREVHEALLGAGAIECFLKKPAGRKPL